MDPINIDLNVDMGESTSLWPYSIDRDIQLLEYISSVNIACGFHAGDPHTMHQLIAASLQRGIAIGAHPSYADREHFGRQSQNLSHHEVYDLLIYQLGALDAFLRLAGARLHHVKPHGALYNDASRDRDLAAAIAAAVYDYDPGLILYGLSRSELTLAGERKGLQVAGEVFADRTYQPDGQLTSRMIPGAIIATVDDSVTQVVQMVTRGTVTATDGTEIAVKADTICLHSDGPDALTYARVIHDTLNQEGIFIKPI